MTPSDHPLSDRERAAKVHALIDHAVALYDGKRYREALALCEEVARLDPAAALPEVMRGECRRAIRKRRTRRLAVAATACALLAGPIVLYRQFARIRPTPPPGTLRLAEMQTQGFAFHSGLGREQSLAFTWSLLDRSGRPAPDAERADLKPGKHAPWTCAYAPTHSVVKGAAGPAQTRRVVGRGADAAGRTRCRAEWVVEVADVPRPPEVLAVEPPPDKPLALAPGGARTFRVEARDGDDADELDYRWLVGDEGHVVSAEPSWLYERPAGPAPPSPAKQLVVCRVANRAGHTTPRIVTWVVRLVPSNEPPEIVGFEPFHRETIPAKAGEPFRIVAGAHDPDPGDTLQFRWELDGAVISLTPLCSFVLRDSADDASTPHLLHLVVTDSCGATAERSWRVVVGRE